MEKNIILKVLCLGNNTEDTDRRVRFIGKHNYRGLLTELDGPLDRIQYQSPGYYHSSIFDIEITKLFEIVKEFDRIILLDQPLTEWSHPDAFLRTYEFVKNINTDVVIQNPTLYEGIEFFKNLVKENPSLDRKSTPESGQGKS